MEEEKKVNEVETSILENPLNNEKIDITGDLTKMVEEVKNIESAPVEEKTEIQVVEKEVPVIEPKAVDETVTSSENAVIENKVENTTVSIENNNEKVDTSVHDGTVITTIKDSENLENEDKAEKKKLPVNLLAFLCVIIFCVILGIVLWHFFRNEDGSYKEQFFESLSKEENKENNDKKPDTTPVVTPSDDIIVTPSDEVVYTFKTGKYIFNNRTLYLNDDNTFYYVTDENGCMSGNYGTYTVDGNMIDLTSTKYYDCTTCEEKTDSNLNSYVFNIRDENTINLNHEVFDYVGNEESSNLFVCNNENAN